MYRHHPQTLKVKEILDSGVLGKVQLVKGAFSFVLRREGDIRMQKETGGGSIWDVGCYPISYTRMIVGAEPLEVFGWQVEGRDGIDISFIGQMRFGDDILCQFDCGFKSPNRAYMEIVGTEATLNIPNPFKPYRNTNLVLTRGDHAEVIKVKGEELYLGEVENLVDVILRNAPPRVTLEDSRGNIATILALIESARTGKPITPK